MQAYEYAIFDELLIQFSRDPGNQSGNRHFLQMAYINVLKLSSLLLCTMHTLQMKCTVNMYLFVTILKQSFKQMLQKSFDKSSKQIISYHGIHALIAYLLFVAIDKRLELS